MKKIFAFTLIIITCFLFTACNKNNTEKQNEEQSTEIESTENSEELTIPEISTESTEESSKNHEDDPAYQSAIKFINYLQSNDFDNILDNIALFDNSVITDDNLIEILKKSEWNEIIGTDYRYSFIAIDQRYEDRKTIMFKMNQEQYSIPLVVDYDGKWKISLSDYIVENFQFVVPWEVKVFWNGEELDRTKYSTAINTGNTVLDLYTVTCTPTKTNFKFTSDSYGDFIREITPKPLNEPYELVRNFTEEQRNEVLQGVQKMWNEMFIDYQNGMPEKEWCYKHFAYITTDEEEQAVYNQIKKYLEDNNYIKIEMIDIQQWDNYFSGISMNRVATVNFSYKLKMTMKNDSGQTVEKISDIMYSNIRVEKAAHGYIIFELTDKDLFNDTVNPVKS